MGAVGSVTMILPNAVADGGTFTAPYPDGMGQTDLSGSSGGMVVVNDNDAWKQDSGLVEFSFGATNITVTNRSGATWPDRARVILSFGDVFIADSVVESGADAGGVVSVNGQTGVVELDAADVGALPDDYTPPAAPVQSVNGQTGAVTLTAGDVGAATTAQGALADTAVQPGDLGTAANADTGDFATAAQGALADTAVQPGALAAVATTGQSSDVAFTSSNFTATDVAAALEELYAAINP